MITRAIETCFRSAKEKGWNKTYWAIDIHGTILKPTYNNKISTEFYPYAKEALQLISQRTDIYKILFTCSYPHEVEQYITYFAKHQIHFDNVNQNPEVADGAYGYYHEKIYFNVLMDDKAGFNGETDWKPVYEMLLVGNTKILHS
jgi:hypothetical protein